MREVVFVVHPSLVVCCADHATDEVERRRLYDANLSQRIGLVGGSPASDRTKVIWRQESHTGGEWGGEDMLTLPVSLLHRGCVYTVYGVQ